MGKHKKSIDTMLLRRIYGHGHGWVFTPTHFLDLGNRTAIASALKRHKAKGTIRQIARGLYEFPRPYPKLGRLLPSPDAVAKALAGRDSARLQASGAYAANLLGLSEQVPMKIVFLTDGPSKTVRIGKQEIILKHTTPRNMATAGTMGGLVIQALRYVGQAHVDDGLVEKLRRGIRDDHQSDLRKSAAYAPAWIAGILRRLATPLEYEKASMINTRAEIETLLAENAAMIRSLGVERIGVFGSFARDEQNASSDIDFLVVFTPHEKTWKRFITLAHFLEDRTGRRIELVTPESLPAGMRDRVLSQAAYVPLAA